LQDKLGQNYFAAMQLVRLSPYENELKQSAFDGIEFSINLIELHDKLAALG